MDSTDSAINRVITICIAKNSTAFGDMHSDKMFILDCFESLCFQFEFF